MKLIFKRARTQASLMDTISRELVREIYTALTFGLGLEKLYLVQVRFFFFFWKYLLITRVK